MSTQLQGFMVSDKNGIIAVIADTSISEAAKQVTTELHEALDFDQNTVEIKPLLPTVVLNGKRISDHISLCSKPIPQRLIDYR